MIDLLTRQQTEWLALTLLHSLWQGLVFAGLLVAILRLIPASRAVLRYVICMIAFICVPVSVLATWSWLKLRALSHSGARSNDVALEMPSSLIRPGFSWEEACVAFWVVGVGVMLLRILLAFRQLRALRSRAKGAGDSVTQIVERLVKGHPLIHRIEVLVTDELTTAAVAGLFRPVLFVPVAMATGLSTRQLEAVLAHELAHIRRFDVVTNFLQMLVEAALFFNPAVWWISRQVRQEREACCDVAGVQSIGDAGFYSETLATWAEQLRQLSDSSAVPTAAMGFAAERKSTLVQRVRRILFPHDVPTSQFSPWTTIGLLILGVVLFGSLWKGTQVAVAIVDNLLAHEVVVEELNRKRQEFGEERYPIAGAVQNDGSMGIDIRLKTSDGKPITSDVNVKYASFNQVEHSSHSTLGSLTSIDAGESQKSVDLKYSWAHLLFSSADYAPVLVPNVKPDETGNAVVEVTLSPGYEGVVLVTDDDGKAIPDVEFTLNHVLKYSRKSHQSRSMRSSGGGSAGSRAGVFTSNQKGVIRIPHVNDQPNFSAKLKCEGFETIDVPDLSWQQGKEMTIVLSRALPIEGMVVDGDNNPMPDVRIYEVESQQLSGKNVTRSTTNDDFCGKDFRGPVAVTNADGLFSIRSLNRDWKYVLLADAGDRGCKAIPYVRPGDADVKVTIDGPINIRGTVSGDIERLKTRKGDYKLRYGMSLLIETGRQGSSGRIPLEFVDGRANFELANVVPGKYEFFLDGYERLVRDLKVSESVSDLNIVVPQKAEQKEDTTTERLVRLSFRPEKGVAKFHGRLSVSSRSKDSATYYNRAIDVAEDYVEFPVNAPSKVSVEMMDAPGFLFRNGDDLEFEVNADSKETFVQTATVFPGGAIYGQLLRPDETDDDAWLGVLGKTAWRTEKSYRSTTVSRECDENGRFFIDHLPYGSTTNLIGRHGSWCKQLEPIQVDSKHPQAELRIDIGTGPVLEGTLTDSDGSPVAEMEISLYLFSSEYEKFSAGSCVTGREGTFSFGMINPDAGEHFIKLVPARDYAPVFLAVDGSSPFNVQLRKGGIVEGQLIDDDGRPVANAEVYAMLRDYRVRAVHWLNAEDKTDTQGRFRFSNLGDETYKLNTRVLRRQVTETLVSPGDRSVVLKLKPQG